MANSNRNLFRLTRFILLKLPLLFRFFAQFRTAKKRVLIIKTDAIGDYILFRNFLEATRRSEKYKNYQIDVLGNVIWRDIALNYDATFVNEFLFTRADQQYHSPLITLKLGWQLFKRNYEVVLQPAYSRTLMIDGLAALTAAKQIIGFESDTERITEKHKAKTDSFYTTKLILPPNAFFEFDRNKFFFETVLGESNLVSAPFIPVENKTNHGIVIVPGAGVATRCWEPDRFIGLIKLLVKHTTETIYLEGSPVQIPIEDHLANEISAKRVVNLIGKTSLLQLIDLIGNAAMVIANETSAIHIAAATQTKAVCVLGGGHFNRFSPYPENMPTKPICVYYKMECYNCNWLCKFTIAENEPYPCIGNVSLDAVWDVVGKCL